MLVLPNYAQLCPPPPPPSYNNAPSLLPQSYNIAWGEGEGTKSASKASVPHLLAGIAGMSRKSRLVFHSWIAFSFSRHVQGCPRLGHSHKPVPRTILMGIGGADQSQPRLETGQSQLNNGWEQRMALQDCHWPQGAPDTGRFCVVPRRRLRGRAGDDCQRSQPQGPPADVARLGRCEDTRHFRGVHDL